MALKDGEMKTSIKETNCTKLLSFHFIISENDKLLFESYQAYTIKWEAW